MALVASTSSWGNYGSQRVRRHGRYLLIRPCEVSTAGVEAGVQLGFWARLVLYPSWRGCLLQETADRSRQQTRTVKLGH